MRAKTAFTPEAVGGAAGPSVDATAPLREVAARAEVLSDQAGILAAQGAGTKAMGLWADYLRDRMERKEAMRTLPSLLPSRAQRLRALRVVHQVPGRIDEMAPHTFETLRRMAEVLGLPPQTEDVLSGPLAAPVSVAAEPDAEPAPEAAPAGKPPGRRRIAAESGG